MYEEAFEKMFITAVFTITKIWKQPKCLSTEEWIMKMWYACVYTHTHTHTHIYNEILLSQKKRMKSCHLQQHG